MNNQSIKNEKNLSLIKDLEAKIKGLETETAELLSTTKAEKEALDIIQTAPDPIEAVACRFETEASGPFLRVTDKGLFGEDYSFYIAPMVKSLSDKLYKYKYLSSLRKEYDDLLSDSKNSFIIKPVENKYTDALNKNLATLEDEIEQLSSHVPTENTQQSLATNTPKRHHLVREKVQLDDRLKEIEKIKTNKKSRDGEVTGKKYLFVACVLFGIDAIANAAYSYFELFTPIPASSLYAFLIAVFIGTSAHFFGMLSKDYNNRVLTSVSGTLLLFAAILVIIVPRLTGTANPDFVQAFPTFLNLFLLDDTTQVSSGSVLRDLAGGPSPLIGIATAFQLLILTTFNSVIFFAGIHNSKRYHGSHPDLVKDPLFGKSVERKLKEIEETIAKKREDLTDKIKETQDKLNEAGHVNYIMDQTIADITESLSSIQVAQFKFNIEKIADLYADQLNKVLRFSMEKRVNTLNTLMTNQLVHFRIKEHIVQICEVSLNENIPSLYDPDTTKPRQKIFKENEPTDFDSFKGETRKNIEGRELIWLVRNPSLLEVVIMTLKNQSKPEGSDHEKI